MILIQCVVGALAPELLAHAGFLARVGTCVPRYKGHGEIDARSRAPGIFLVLSVCSLTAQPTA